MGKWMISIGLDMSVHYGVDKNVVLSEVLMHVLLNNMLIFLSRGSKNMKILITDYSPH